jgi:pimeloyl-ACP methyl ester carboxylesterase
MFVETQSGININVKVYGDENNSAIVLLHGIGADYEMFSPQIEEYKNNDFCVIVPDMRGHGESSKVEQLKLTDFTYDIKEILDHFNIEKAIIVGVSMGGVIAQQFAVDYSNRVKRLIIVDSFGKLDSTKEKLIGKIQVFGFKVFKYLPKKIGAKLFASAYKNISKDAEKYFEEKSMNIDYEQLILARKAINKIDILKDLENIEIPSLVIVGDQVDIMIKASKKIVNSLKDSKLVILKDSMDPSNLVSPEEFNTKVLEFINN